MIETTLSSLNQLTEQEARWIAFEAWKHDGTLTKSQVLAGLGRQCTAITEECMAIINDGRYGTMRFKCENPLTSTVDLTQYK